MTAIASGLGGAIVKVTAKVGALRAGLAHKTLSVNGYTTHYYEGGSGPPLVLLHGLADDKASFVASAAGLTKNFRVVLPDLPGHGDNARDPDKDASIRGNALHLKAFFEKAGMGRFHLGGNSMGGHISLAFTLLCPERVDKLILVNAPGFQLEGREVYTGFGAHIETKEALFAQAIDRVFYKRPKMPGPVVEHLIAQVNRDREFTNAVTRAVKAGEDYALNDRIAGIQQKTLILWGRHDVVVVGEVAEAYRDRIPNSSLVWLENTAHSPQLEVPNDVAKAIGDFLAPAAR